LDKRILYKNLSILLLNPDGSTACRLQVDRAFPVKWEASQLTSKSGEIFMETLTLTHRGIRKY
jgi:phage tail-like protein